MGPGETAGIVVVTVAFIQGLIAFAKFVINKFTDKEEVKVQEEILGKLSDIETRATQREIVDKLIVITETQSRMLNIVERIERRQESLN